MICRIKSSSSFNIKKEGEHTKLRAKRLPQAGVLIKYNNKIEMSRLNNNIIEYNHTYC